MNDEIKEILNNLKNKDNDIKGINFLKYQDLTRDEIDLLLDYIINLQQEIQEANDSITWWTNRFKAVERENERLKDIVVEKDNQIKEMILQKTDYTAVNILEMKLEDYKSRCEKAIEYIKGTTFFGLRSGKTFMSNYLNDLLTILQNGSEKSEN